MNKSRPRRVLALTAGALMLATAAALPAAAQLEYKEGGTWDHGVNNSYGGTVYSNYYHPSVCHGSSVQGKTYQRAFANPGNWSYASAPSRGYGETDYAYYRTSCN